MQQVGFCLANSETVTKLPYIFSPLYYVQIMRARTLSAIKTCRHLTTCCVQIKTTDSVAGDFFKLKFSKQDAHARFCRRIKREHELHTRQVPRQFVPAHCSHEQPFYHRADVPPRANKAAKWLVHLIHSIFRRGLQFTCYRYFYPRYKIVLQSPIS